MTRLERIRLTQKEKEAATMLGTLPVLIFVNLIRLLNKTKRWLTILSMIFFLGWSINYLAPKAFSPRADASQPFQNQVVVTLPFKAHPDLKLRDTVLSLVRIEFGEDQVYAFDNLITHESGWDPQAINQSSGACGLPQALPCSKMDSMDIHDQIKFLFDYTKSRYGTPVKAWAFWQTLHLINGRMVHYW